MAQPTMANDLHITSTPERTRPGDEPPQPSLIEDKRKVEKCYELTGTVERSQGVFCGNGASDEDSVSAAESDVTPVKVGAIGRIWHWKPSATRYDPDNPPKFTVWLNILFAFVGLGPTELRRRTAKLTRSTGRSLYSCYSVLQPSHSLQDCHHLWRVF